MLSQLTNSSASLGLMALSYMRPRLQLPPSPHRAQLETLPIPPSFDARTAYKACAGSIGRIRNQGHCGSCWAFGAVESLADRICIAGNNTRTITLSAQSLIDCDTVDHGCNGGYLDLAWKGLVSRGALDESCDPYTHCAYPPLANCSKPSRGGLGVAEHISAPSPPRCPNRCAGDGNGSPQPLKWHKAASAYAVAEPGDVSAMQRELMTRGPFEVAFFVYSDFYHYRGGVYRKSPKAQGPLGGHAVKLVGWGEEAGGGGPYWVIANSWSPSWGEEGFFRIARGTNECGIETTPAAGLPAAVDHAAVAMTKGAAVARRQSELHAMPVRPPLETQFAATMRVAQADHGPDDQPGDGCILARKLKPAPHIRFFKLSSQRIWFDAKNTRIAQVKNGSEARPERATKTIGRFDLPRHPSLLVEQFFNGSICYAQPIHGLCPNGTSACPPDFGHFGKFGTPFTSTLGMYYLNTSFLEHAAGGDGELWQYTDNRPTLMPNGSTVIITRNYTYHLSPAPPAVMLSDAENAAAAPRQLRRLEWTQGLPGDVGSHDARLCTVIDFTQDYVSGAPPLSAFEPPGGVPSCVWP